MSRDNLLNVADRVTDPGFISRLVQMLEQILHGRTRNQAAITLTANVTTTAVNNPAFESHQTVVLSPLTANAAGAIATTYVSARTKGQFTLTHANAATTDRSFEFIFVG